MWYHIVLQNIKASEYDVAKKVRNKALLHHAADDDFLTFYTGNDAYVWESDEVRTMTDGSSFFLMTRTSRKGISGQQETGMLSGSSSSRPEELQDRIRLFPWESQSLFRRSPKPSIDKWMMPKCTRVFSSSHIFSLKSLTLHLFKEWAYCVLLWTIIQKRLLPTEAWWSRAILWLSMPTKRANSRGSYAGLQYRRFKDIFRVNRRYQWKAKFLNRCGFLFFVLCIR